MLDKLQKRIQELVPEIIDKEFINLPIARDIKLEDVLVAIDPELDYMIDTMGNIMRWKSGDKEMVVETTWKLNKPLQEQSKKCIEFLYKLLVTDK